MKPVMESRELPLNSCIRVHGHAEVVVPRGVSASNCLAT